MEEEEKIPPHFANELFKLASINTLHITKRKFIHCAPYLPKYCTQLISLKLDIIDNRFYI